MLGYLKLALPALAALALAACESATNPDGIHGKFFTRAGAYTGQAEDFQRDMESAIGDPAGTIVIVYNHGTVQSGIRQRCVPDSAPPYFKDAANWPLNDLPVVVYYLCSQQTGAGSRGGYANSTFLKRGNEIEDVLDRFIAHGVPPARIVVAGHSGGGPAALIAASRSGDKMAAVIATAPGYGFAYLGVEALNRQEIRGIRDNWQRDIARGLEVPALVYAFVGDDVSPPEDLQFLRQLPSVDLQVMDAGQYQMQCVPPPPHPHATPFLCFTSQHPRVTAFIREAVK